jgi:signal transduction histidine kinase
MGLRHRSIRFRVGILIAVPVLSLIALYFFAASFTLGGAIGEAHARTLRDDLFQPVTSFQAQLSTERHLAVLVLKYPTSDAYLMAYNDRQGATDVALGKLQAELRSPQVTSNASAHELAAIGHMIAAAKTLPLVRNDVRADAMSLAGAVGAYDSVIDAGFPVMDQALEEQTSVPLVTQALDLVSLARVGELASQEADLLTGVSTDRYFPRPDRVAFAELAVERQQLLAQTMADLAGRNRATVMAAVPASLDSAVANLENHVIGTSWRGTAPATVTSGPATLDTYAATIDAGASRAGDEVQAQAQSQADTVFLQLLLAGALGLIGIIASLALSLVLGRSLIRQLRNLRSSALTLAHDKLPHVIRLLREGQQVDTAEYDRPAEPTRNEIEQVQQSFDVVQKAAVQSAVDEARLRRGVSDVFRNLAGRSLSLLQRQLALLDSMERRASEPAELQDLFRLDHLTTRMRRHAEGLIILSGAAPSRTWRHPVPLVDVLRAAVAEVEDYTRIQVLSRTTNALAGHAIADVIHLIAELAENATVFSPPSTTVRIQGDLVGRGFAVEIEDRGLGISAARLAEINANLADPPPFDLAGSDRLGLFIAGQLAKRHDISITLQPSVFGGITAVVLIPLALVVADDDYERDWALAAATQAADVPLAHEALAVPVPDLKAAGNGHASPDLDNGYARLGLAATAPAVVAAAAPLLPPVLRPGAAGPAPVADAAPSVQASLGDESEARVTTAELAELGLPLRVRQASLAPQLRDPASGPRPTVMSQDARLASESPLPPSPDAARDTVSALQRGWQLGRAVAGGQPGEPAGDGVGDAAGRDTGSGIDDADARNGA